MPNTAKKSEKSAKFPILYKNFIFYFVKNMYNKKSSSVDPE